MKYPKKRQGIYKQLLRNSVAKLKIQKKVNKYQREYN